ncbi:ABC transporter ATP-binding protein [Cohnella lubricantis]|uniref:ABC transporter ATP-binding protein n=1 Tax=Cohnella lubricantis TaxID=2163172 RepID=A0A841TCN4_9BACL|nr:ABC transporter ATP-binding protein [Cohnella lubricantis]MBB6678772.1 ABC transporter ATP-binding protein [Cohnella lubricantis]MBP2117856.1 ABC-type polysaccharide/polyol phosphate transport system ATPase subunit [Cohnella lubricantis]
MSDQTAISLNRITKVYKLYDKPVDRLKEAINPFGRKYHKEFYAVNDVSFSIAKNETVGIIGKNGSGKSTLLKMITGVLTPTSGSLKVDGSISALLELGAGFNPEYTGIENIYLNGTIRGFSKEKMDEKLDDILSFADIGDFVHQPVKIYSSGMFVRLAFAVAINVDPEILIIDEALSVGDIRFQQKCFRKIEEFKQNKTVLFVSHDMATITNYCDRAIWINEGAMIEDGSPRELAKQYQAYMMGSKITKSEALQAQAVPDTSISQDEVDDLPANLDVLGDNKARITGITMLDGITNEKSALFFPGQAVKLIIKLVSHENIENPLVGFSIKDRLGNIIAECNNVVIDADIDDVKSHQTVSYSFAFQLPQLNKGTYTISPAVASGTLEDHVQHSWVHDAFVFQVMSTRRDALQGLLVLDNVEFNQLQ